MPFGGLGMWEVLLILLVLLLVFGAKRLPELGGSLGKGIREFKKSVKEIETELNRSVFEEQRELQRGTSQVQQPPAPPAAEPVASAQTAAKSDTESTGASAS